MLSRYLERFSLLAPEDIQQALPLFRPRTLKKNDCFIREGECCTEVAFVCSGILRSYHTSESGDDMTYCFSFPNDLMTAYSSFITGAGSMEHIQAIVPAELLVVAKSDLEALMAKQPAWEKFARIMAEQQYLELEKRVFQLQRDSAAQRYRDLLRHRPEYIRDIPLGYLASYLHVTPRHLSRIRREIAF